MNDPTPAEVIESCLIEITKIGRCNAAAESVIAHLEAAGFAIVPKVPTAMMIAAALPIVDNFGDEEIATAKRIGADAVLLLSPHGRAHQPIDKRAVSLAEGMVCDYRRMIAAV